MNARRFRRGRQLAAAVVVSVVALLLLNARATSAQTFFSYPAPPPVASPATAVNVSPAAVKITSPYMWLDGGGNPRMQNWFVKADASLSLTIGVQAGNDGPGGSPSTIPITVSVFNGATLLTSFVVTQPLSTPPAASGSATIATTPGTTYRINLAAPGLAPFAVYRLKLDGAAESQLGGTPLSIAGDLSSGQEGTRWLMNVAPGEALNFAMLGSTQCFPAPLPGTVCSLPAARISVFGPDLSRVLFDDAVATTGSNYSFPAAGSIPGAWTIVMDQPSTVPGNRVPYRLVKGNVVSTTTTALTFVAGSQGSDPGVYAAWSTDGKASAIQIFAYSPPAVTSFDVTISPDVYTGHGVGGTTGSQSFTSPTNTTLTITRPDTGQYHFDFTAPPGYVADPAHTDVPATSEALTSIVVYIKDVTPPVLSLPTAITVPASGPLGATVTFTATASDFIDGARPVTCTPASGSTFAIGDNLVECSASDTSGNGATGSFHVIVTPSTPVCTAAVATPNTTLWPPNHSLVPISVAGVTNADGSTISFLVNSIFQDEPTNAKGDGDTPIDAVGVGTNLAQVRSERSGNGDGRVYYINFNAITAGGICGGTVTVAVQHNQKNPAVGGGPNYDSTQP